MDWNRDIQMAIINALMLSICILLYKKRKILGSYRFLMIGAMVVTYIVDVLTFYIRLDKDVDKSISLYVYLYGTFGLFFLLLFLMYQKLINNKVLKNIAKLITGLFLAFYTYQIYIFKIENGFPDNLLFFNVFLLLFTIALFLLDKFQTDIILDIKYYYPFWFSLGLIIIYLAIVPSVIISDIPNVKKNKSLWSLMIFIVNIIGYGIIFAGLFKAKKLD